MARNVKVLIGCYDENWKKVDEHIEELPVETDNTKKELKEMCEIFNLEEKRRKEINPNYYISFRKLLKIVSENEGYYCEWDKSIIQYPEDKGEVRWTCKRCGRMIKCVLAPPTKRCYPERTCSICNRVFSSESRLRQHEKLSKDHKEKEERGY